MSQKTGVLVGILRAAVNWFGFGFVSKHRFSFFFFYVRQIKVKGVSQKTAAGKAASTKLKQNISTAGRTSQILHDVAQKRRVNSVYTFTFSVKMR